jgi:hypothetical protein
MIIPLTSKYFVNFFVTSFPPSVDNVYTELLYVFICSIIMLLITILLLTGSVSSFEYHHLNLFVDISTYFEFVFFILYGFL